MSKSTDGISEDVTEAIRPDSADAVSPSELEKRPSISTATVTRDDKTCVPNRRESLQDIARRINIDVLRGCFKLPLSSTAKVSNI